MACKGIQLNAKSECEAKDGTNSRLDSCSDTNKYGFNVDKNQTDSFSSEVRLLNQELKGYDFKRTEKEFDSFYGEKVKIDANACENAENDSEKFNLEINDLLNATTAGNGTDLHEKKTSDRIRECVCLEDNDIETNPDIVGKFGINFSPLSDACYSDDEQTYIVAEERDTGVEGNDRNDAVRNSCKSDTNTSYTPINSQTAPNDIDVDSEDKCFHNLETLYHDYKAGGKIGSVVNSDQGSLGHSEDVGSMKTNTNEIWGTDGARNDDMWTSKTDILVFTDQRKIVTDYTETEVKNLQLNKIDESALEKSKVANTVSENHNNGNGVGEMGTEETLSKVLSQSQDTMEFSCDTLNNESQWQSSLENVEHSNAKTNDSFETGVAVQQDRLRRTECETLYGSSADVIDSLDEDFQQNVEQYPNSNTARDCIGKPLDLQNNTQMTGNKRELKLLAHARQYGHLNRSEFDSSDVDETNQLSPLPHPSQLFKRNWAPRTQNVNLISSMSVGISRQTIPAQTRVTTAAASFQHGKGHYSVVEMSNKIVKEERLQFLKGDKLAGGFQYSLEQPKPFQYVDSQMSPFQRLSDSDDLLQSPKFYFDFGDVKPELRTMVTISNTGHDDTSLAVPCVTLTDLPVSSPSLTPSSQHTDEDVYQELYKPRKMYSSNDNLSMYNFKTPPTNNLSVHPLNLAEQCILPVLGSIMGPSAESVPIFITVLGSFMGPAESVPRFINQTCTLGESKSANALGAVNLSDCSVSQCNSSMAIFRRKRQLENSSPNAIPIDGFHTDQYSPCLGEHSESQQSSQSVSMYHNAFSYQSKPNDSLLSMNDLQNQNYKIKPMENCKQLGSIKENTLNVLSQVHNQLPSDDDFPVNDKLDMLEHHNSNQSDVDNKLINNLPQNSKWQKFAQSQSSDETDVDLAKYTVKEKEIDRNRVFHVLDKPCGLFSTQSLRYTVSSKAVNQTETPNTMEKQAVNKHAMHPFSADSQLSFSSMDSFEKMLVDNDFGIDNYAPLKGSEKYNKSDQIVPVEEEISDVSKVNGLTNIDYSNGDEISNETAKPADNANEFMVEKGNDLMLSMNFKATDKNALMHSYEIKGNESDCYKNYDNTDKENITESCNKVDTELVESLGNDIQCDKRNSQESINCIPPSSGLDTMPVAKMVKFLVLKNDTRSKCDANYDEKTHSLCCDNGKERIVDIDEEYNWKETEDTKSDDAASQPNVAVFNTSLDVSFSLEDSIAISDETHDAKTSVGNKSKKLVAGLRIAWKPPVKAVKDINNTVHEIETENSKPTFKCLKILEKARTHQNGSRESAKYNSEGSVTNTALDEWERRPDSGSKLIEIKKTNRPTSTETDVCLSVNTRESSVNRRFKPPTMSVSQAVVGAASVQTLVPSRTTCSPRLQNYQSVSCRELCFPGQSEVECSQPVVRVVCIPATFPNVAEYKNTLTQALTEYLNAQMFDVARRYHQALSQLDTSRCAGSDTKSPMSAGSRSSHPLCQCGMPSKMALVKKEGPNQGRGFYTCSAERKQQCKFFQWADANARGSSRSFGSKCKVDSVEALNLQMKTLHVHFYGESVLVQRAKQDINRYIKAPKRVRARGELDACPTKQMLLRLPYKGHFSLYGKDDLWVISRQLDFDPSCTFLARSTFHGPSSTLEVELEPVCGYAPSNWANGTVCHALLAGNASSELSCLNNVREYLQSQSPPIVQHLLDRNVPNQSIGNTVTGFQAPRAAQNTHTGWLSSEEMDYLAEDYIKRYTLNTDQTEALRRVASIFTREKTHQVGSLLLIHGVFGAGKSYLLSVVVLFLMEVFGKMAALSPQQQSPWKLLISSTTNVAVDRILMGLLDLGFEDFVRVGSVKKIAKPVLPYSVHAAGTDSQELKDLQQMLRSSDLTATEKSHVRKGIEKLRKGENKKKLGRVQVVGATCASCSLSCLQNIQFPLVLLDECSQMTEPASLLPIARFQCQKLILVGDPKQLDPTIQGAECAHPSGLEQTLFDRLIHMGHIPTLLRTQYRCHPRISAIANSLFYGDMLRDGVTEADRQPLLSVLPTLCYYDVSRGAECSEGVGSFYNESEAQFVVFLLETMVRCGLETGRLGVITLYRAQMARIMDLLASSGAGDDCREVKGVQVSTVDAFQGGERDIIILSTVRTNHTGFIDNDKRMNVALTRARHHLLIVGHHGNLSANTLWGKVIEHCKSYPDGVQCADEARFRMEQYLQSQVSEKPAKDNNSQSSKGDKSQSSVKGSHSNSRSSSQSSVTFKRTKISEIGLSVQGGSEVSEQSGKVRKKRQRKQKTTTMAASVADADVADLFDGSETEMFEKDNISSSEKELLLVPDKELLGSEGSQSRCFSDVYGESETTQDEEQVGFAPVSEAKKVFHETTSTWIL